MDDELEASKAQRSENFDKICCDEIDSTEDENNFDFNHEADEDKSKHDEVSSSIRTPNERASPDLKRQKSSPSSPLSNIPSSPSVSASPPKFVALEEIMKAANDLSNIYLAHEIALNENFKLEKKELPANHLRKRVDDMMRKAFWDILKLQLSETPPNFKNALSLLSEIKENLISFLLPQHTRLKQEIEEILDHDLIQQQAENGALDFQRYAQYVLSVMARLCAPVRDEKIRELTQTSDVIQLFKGIMELLDLMKLDMANFLVKKYRPHILQKSFSYEKEKFIQFLELQTKMNNLNGLQHTRAWLKRNYLSLDLKGESLKETINKVLTSAYIELLVWDKQIQESFPETLMMDEARITSLSTLITVNILIGSIILITVTAFPALQNVAKLKDQLKDHLLTILTPKEDQPTEIESLLENASIQVAQELKEFHQNQKDFGEIDLNKLTSVTAQINQLSNKSNRIRQVIQRRILEFIESVFTSNTASPVRIPSGLSSLQDNLASITGLFMRVANHNRAVFGDYYVTILTELIENK